MKLVTYAIVMAATARTCKAFVPSRTIMPLAPLNLYSSKSTKTIVPQTGYQKQTTPLFMSDAAASPEPKNKGFLNKVSGIHLFTRIISMINKC